MLVVYLSLSNVAQELKPLAQNQLVIMLMSVSLPAAVESPCHHAKSVS